MSRPKFLSKRSAEIELGSGAVNPAESCSGNAAGRLRGAEDAQAPPPWVDIRNHPVDASTKAGTAIFRLMDLFAERDLPAVSLPLELLREG